MRSVSPYNTELIQTANGRIVNRVFYRVMMKQRKRPPRTPDLKAAIEAGALVLLLGDKIVERGISGRTELTRPFYRYVNEGACFADGRVFVDWSGRGKEPVGIYFAYPLPEFASGDELRAIPERELYRMPVLRISHPFQEKHRKKRSNPKKEVWATYNHDGDVLLITKIPLKHRSKEQSEILQRHEDFFSWRNAHRSTMDLHTINLLYQLYVYRMPLREVVAQAAKDGVKIKPRSLAVAKARMKKEIRSQASVSC